MLPSELSSWTRQGWGGRSAEPAAVRPASEPGRRRRRRAQSGGRHRPGPTWEMSRPVMATVRACPDQCNVGRITPREFPIQRLRTDHERDVLFLALCVEHPRSRAQPRASNTSPRVAAGACSSPRSGRLMTASAMAVSPSSAPAPPGRRRPAPSGISGSGNSTETPTMALGVTVRVAHAPPWPQDASARAPNLLPQMADGVSEQFRGFRSRLSMVRTDRSPVQPARKSPPRTRGRRKPGDIPTRYRRGAGDADS